MLGCTAVLSWMAHARGGGVLALGYFRRYYAEHPAA
jgi:hypothetical protein